MEEKRKSRLPIAVIIIFGLVLAALYAYIYLLPQISDSGTETSIVGYASIETSAKLSCIIAREESVYTSGKAGRVSFYAEEGAKTRKSAKIVDVYSGSDRTSFKASTTGVVTYYLDGCEDRFKPSGLSELDPDELSKTGSIIPKSTKPESVEGDTPIFKLVTSDTWYVILLMPKDLADEYTVGQRISLKFEDDSSIPAKVTLVKRGESQAFAVCSCSRYYDKALSLRTAEVTVVSSVTEGLLVPTTALATNGENIGVYVLKVDGDYSFRAVDVLVSGDSETLIRDGGNVKLYDEVLKNATNYNE